MMHAPGKADSVADRLCLAQADLSEEKAETRQAYYDEIVEKALTGLNDDERAVFLDTLAERFPVSHETRGSSAEQPSVDELAAAISACPFDIKRELLDRLGVQRASPPDISGDIESAATKLMRQLDMSEIEPARVFEIAGLFTAFAAALDQTAWSAWRAFAPSSNVQRRIDPLSAVKRYLGGDPEGSFGETRLTIDALRKLLVALTAALGHVTHQLAHENFARIAPGEIENLVGMESGGFLTSKEVRCWRKYVEMAEDFTEARMEQDIKGRVIRCVESLMNVAGH